MEHCCSKACTRHIFPAAREGMELHHLFPQWTAPSCESAVSSQFVLKENRPVLHSLITNSSVSSLHWRVILSPKFCNISHIIRTVDLMLWRYLQCWTAFIEFPSQTFSPLTSSKQKSFNPSLNWKMENVWLYASVQYFKGQSSKPHTCAWCMNK